MSPFSWLPAAAAASFSALAHNSSFVGEYLHRDRIGRPDKQRRVLDMGVRGPVSSADCAVAAVESKVSTLVEHPFRLAALAG
jgi:hypothetical protein